jgi:SAM-dependent methyltransferase
MTIHDPDAKPEDVHWRSAGAEFAGNDPLSAGAPESIPLPVYTLREASSVGDLGAWYAIGEGWSQTAILHGPANVSRILDIGCGCGKMARLFAMIPGVNYLGIDVFPPAISWSQQAFRRFGDFRFTHFDVHSPLYNPTGVLNVETATVPADDRSADLIICASLFTHLLESSFRHYLREVARCLDTDGVAIISTHNEPESGSRFSGKETRIDISDDYLIELAREAGLTAKKVGTIFGQEVFRLVK